MNSCQDKGTDRRRKKEFGDTYSFMFDNIMPEEDQEILVCTKEGYVEKDVCMYDDGCYLDSGYDFAGDIAAWMPLPEPYKGDEK